MKVFLLTASIISFHLIFGQETYTNPIDPILNISDPFVLKDEGTYYLYATTDVNDGFRSWKSADLIDWQAVGWVFRKSAETWGQRNFWAPEVFHFQGKFYLVYSSAGQTMFGQGMRICISVADRPEGPFEELHAPLFDFGYQTIDAHVYVEDERPYLYYEKVGAVGNFTKQKGYLWGMVFGVELEKDLSGPIHEPKLCIYPQQDWEGIHSMWARSNEGMTVFKVDTTYYMMYSGNHWADPNYAIGYATSDQPVGGLWVKYEGNPILQKDLSKGVSGPGHNSIVESPDGTELFVVYHTHILGQGKYVNRTLNPENEEILGRTLNIDRMKIKEDGSLSIVGPTRTPQEAPR